MALKKVKLSTNVLLNCKAGRGYGADDISLVFEKGMEGVVNDLRSPFPNTKIVTLQVAPKFRVRMILNNSELE